MRNELKKSFMILMVFLVLIVSISAISAVNDDSIDETLQADDIELEPTLEASSDDGILSDEGDKNFSALNKEISENNVLNLDSNYVYSADTDSSLKDGITIDKAVTINGNGKTITGNNNKLFVITNAGSLTLKNLTIISTYTGYGEKDLLISNNGNLTFENVKFTVERVITKSSSTYTSLYYNTIVNNANMFIRNSTFKDSTIKHETSITSSNTKTYYYGLIYNNGANSNLEIEDSAFDNNKLSSSLKMGSTLSFASLIHNEKGILKLSNVLITNNYVGYDSQSNPKNFKGFIYNNGGTLEILGSTIRDNIMNFPTQNIQRNGIINSVGGSSTINNNIIINNTFENYEVESTGDYSFDNNYWGTNNPDFKKLTNNKIPDNFVVLGFTPEEVTTGEEKIFELTLTATTGSLPDYNVVVNSEKLGATTVEIKNGVGQYKYLPIKAGVDTITINGEKYNITVNAAPAGTFTDLKNLIDENSEIELFRDYIYNATTDSSLKTGIPINKTITINGNGYVINSTDAARLFNIDTTGKLTIKNAILLTDNIVTVAAISNGNILNKGELTLENVTFTSKRTWKSGTVMAPVINNNAAISNLTIKNSNFIDSYMNYIGGTTAVPYGLIYNKGTVIINGSTFRNNSIYSDGSSMSGQTGFIYNQKTLIIEDSIFENNSITHNRDGNVQSTAYGIIYGYGASSEISIDNSEFKENRLSTISSNGNAATYGAVSSRGGKVTVSNSNFTKNSAIIGAALSIHTLAGTLISENNIFEDNTAKTNGGAIFVYGTSTLTSTNDKYINNSATNGGAIYGRTYTTNIPIITVEKSIFEGNNATTGSAIFSSTKTTVNNNYWATNTPDFTILISNGTDSLTPNNYVIMTIEGETLALPESTATYTVNFKTNDTDAICELPDYTVDLSATNTLSEDSITITKGTASFTYTSTLEEITDTIKASVDSQEKATLTVKVGEDPTAKGTYKELDRLIRKTDGELGLVKDYTFDAAIDAGFENGIVIDKAITINGNGFTINGTDLAKLFDVKSTGNLTLKNIIIVSDYSKTGAYNNVRPEASFKNLGTVTFDNVTFTLNQNVTTTDKALAAGIYNKGTLKIKNSKFVDSYISTNTQSYCFGLIDNDGGNLNIEDTIFNNNRIIESYAASYVNGLIYNIGTLRFANVNVTNNYMESKSTTYGLIRGYTNSAITIDNSRFENNTIISADNKAYGSAIYTASGSMTITNSKFIKNTANSGGAIYSTTTSTFINNTFEKNTAGMGGAIYSSGSDTKYINNIFKENKATDTTGGAIHSTVTFQSSKAYNFTGNTFIDNEAATNGGAVYVGASIGSNNYPIESNIFINNKAAKGGAIYSTGTLKITSAIFRGNEAGEGAAMYTTGPSVSTITYSIFEDNVATSPTGTLIYYAGSSTANNNYWGTNTPDFSGIIAVKSGTLLLPTNIAVLTIEGNETLYTSDNYLIKFVDNVTGNVIDQLPDYEVNLTSNINKLTPNSIVISDGEAVFTYNLVNCGEDTIKAVSNGVEKAKFDITVFKDPSFSIAANDVDYSDKLDFTFTLSAGPEGTNIYRWTIFSQYGLALESGYIDSATKIIDYNKTYTTGNYTIVVSLKDIVGWTDLEVSDTFEVKQKATEIVPTIEVNYDHTLTIGVIVKADGKQVNATGDVITYFDKKYSATVENGQATINTDEIIPNTYPVTLTYTGDSNYKGSTNITTVTVPKYSSEMIITIGDVEIGKDVNVNITLANATGEITVIVDGDKKIMQLVNHSAEFTIPSIKAGKHYVTGIYMGNETYDAITNTHRFEVEKLTTDINVTSTVIDVGGVAEITISVDKNATGRILLKAGDKSTIGIIENGIAHVVISNLKVGVYNINATYEGDGFYLEAKNNTATITVNLRDSGLTASAANVTVNENVTINVEINKAVTGKVSAYLGDGIYPVELVNGKGTVTISGLPADVYTAKVAFAGDDIFNESSVDVTFKVSKKEIPSELNISMNIPEGTTSPEFTVSLPSDATGNFTVTVDGKEYTAALVNGSATVKVPDLTVGNHTISSSYSGDDNYNKITSENSTLSIPKATIPGGDSALNLTTPEGLSSPSYSISLPTDATGNLTVTVDGKEYTAALVNGSATVTVPNLAPGAHNITVAYTGDEKYSSISKTTTYNVAQKTTPQPVEPTKKASKITAKKKSFKANKKVKKYTITLKSGKKPIKGVKVTLKINGKTYKAKTNAKGKATFKIKKLTKKGKYKAVIKFKGNKTYKATSKKVKITIK